MTCKLQRDVVIEFAGMPKSGKTTVLDIVSHYLRRQRIPLAEYHGGGRYAPIGKADLSALNLYLATEAIRYLLLVGNEGKPPRVHLMDRGINDRAIFTDALLGVGKVNTEHSQAITNLLALEDLAEKVDLCLVFTTSADLSLERENRHKLISADGTVMNPPLLEALKDAATNFGDAPKISAARSILQVDTAILDSKIADTARFAIDAIATAMASAGCMVERAWD